MNSLNKDNFLNGEKTNSIFEFLSNIPFTLHDIILVHQLLSSSSYMTSKSRQLPTPLTLL